MTPSPDTLMQAQDGEFIGVFRKPAGESSIAVYEAKLPEGSGGLDAFRFRQAMVLAGETTITGTAVVTAAVESPHSEGDGHTHAEVAVAADGGETGTDASVASIFTEPSQFAHLLEQLEGKPAEVLDMPRDHTNLGSEGVQALGFSATGHADVLTLELGDDQELAAAA
jgi:hypothetical protein